MAAVYDKFVKKLLASGWRWLNNLCFVIPSRFIIRRFFLLIDYLNVERILFRREATAMVAW